MPELAYETVKLEINVADVPFTAEEFYLQVASRSEAGDVLEF